MHVRRFASASKRLRQSKAAAAKEELPELRATMRRLAFMIHPDRFPDAPQSAAANAQSLSYLQGLLSTVQKSKESHPPASVQRLRLHVREDTPDRRIRVVEHTVRTTGGDCQAVVERSLGEMFGKLGLPPGFRWGAGDWQLLTKSELSERDNREPQASPEAEPQAAAAETEQRPAPAFDAEAVAPRRKPLADAQSLAEALQRLDPMLEALAAVPWLPLSPAGAERRHYLTHHVLGTLGQDGWRLERGVASIWSGARDVDALVSDELEAGTDAASVQALKLVMCHARKFEEELGPPQYETPVASEQTSA